MTAMTLFLNGAGREAAALSLLHFLWQGALLGLAGAIALKLLERSAPQVRYRAACVVLLAIAIAPLATFVILTTPSPHTPLNPLEPGHFFLSVAGGLGEISGPKPAWLPTVLALWMLGAGLCSLRTAGGWALAVYRLSAQRKVAGEAVRNAARSIAQQMGLQRKFRRRYRPSSAGSGP